MDDPSPPILAAFGIDASALIGAGARSLVYALDETRVLRVLRRPAPPASLGALRDFLAGIDGRLPCPTAIIEAIDPAGRYTVERRLAGRSLLARFATLSGEERRTALRNFAAGAEAVGSIHMPGRPYGQLLAEAPIVAPTWDACLRLSLDRYVAANAATIAGFGPVEGLRASALTLLDHLPKTPPKALVHGDYFPGNVLLDDALAVSGLVDFSVFTVVGDRMLDIVGSAIFLEMIDEASPGDIAFVRDRVLARHGRAIEPAGAFYRAYFALAMADPANAGGLYPKLFRWSLDNLGRLAADRMAF